MLRKTMIVLAKAAALTSRLTVAEGMGAALGAGAWADSAAPE